ncbi:TIGR03085 family metal-binding protein [Cellulomonas sp. S1-8]|uniref:TIGR03085 family metal-binding protein n=1 Tax=Cellulomonas sp. S1-8 TaxID=2904790 RepID=UPI002244EE77|nr:TIGR03085 family metal-binding protein [Cellulomonas sp. S1-8]UZN01590.1 TIGR03085 family metal-binding protein [Cellulomonas sp. S1-8]
MTWHETERGWLADALRAADPQDPTLCDGWQARHLAAHLVLREHPGVASGAVRGGLGAATERLAATATDPAGYAALVDRFAAPPPRWSPLTWAGDAVNLTEYFVHTEDVRRGTGARTPRDLPDALAEALWSQLVRMAALRLRRLGPGVVLVRDDDVRCAAHSPRTGHGTVVLRGGVGELVLAVSGRLQAADVRVDGTPDDVRAVRDLLTGP